MIVGIIEISPPSTTATANIARDDETIITRGVRRHSWLPHAPYVPSVTIRWTLSALPRRLHVSEFGHGDIFRFILQNSKSFIKYSPRITRWCCPVGAYWTAVYHMTQACYAFWYFNTTSYSCFIKLLFLCMNRPPCFISRAKEWVKITKCHKMNTWFCLTLFKV
jgi:hypothetical protein